MNLTMQSIDVFIAVVYAGFFLHLQRKQWMQLYRQARPGFEGFTFAFFFLMATLYTSVTKNAAYRRGFIMSVVGTPIVLYFLPVHWVAIVNAIFAVQMVTYVVVGHFLVRKFNMHSF